MSTRTRQMGIGNIDRRHLPGPPLCHPARKAIVFIALENVPHPEYLQNTVSNQKYYVCTDL
jgi:hypothetical protein